MKKRIFTSLALLCLMGAAAWAQTEGTGLTSTDGKSWTLQSMPAYNVELVVKYYATAAYTTVPTEVETVVTAKSAFALIGAGATEQGTVKYAVTATEEAPTQGWSTNVPTADTIKTAGTYYVWYMIEGDATHNDTDPGFYSLTIYPTPVLTLIPAEQSFDLEKIGGTVKVNEKDATLDEDKNIEVIQGTEVEVTLPEGYIFKSVENNGAN